MSFPIKLNPTENFLCGFGFFIQSVKIYLPLPPTTPALFFSLPLLPGVESNLLDVYATALVCFFILTCFGHLLHFLSRRTFRWALGHLWNSHGLQGSASDAVSCVPKSCVSPISNLFSIAFCRFLDLLGSQGELFFKNPFTTEKRIFSQITCPDFDSEKSVHYTYH